VAPQAVELLHEVDGVREVRAVSMAD